MVSLPKAKQLEKTPLPLAVPAPCCSERISAAKRAAGFVACDSARVGARLTLVVLGTRPLESIGQPNHGAGTCCTSGDPCFTAKRLHPAAQGRASAPWVTNRPPHQPFQGWTRPGACRTASR